MERINFLSIAQTLENVGLLWQPEVGDEVSLREKGDIVSILVDKTKFSINKLRSTYIWLPNIEQIISQIEARQSFLLHAGLAIDENKICYRTIVQAPETNIQAEADNLRCSLGIALKDLLVWYNRGPQVH